MALTQISVPSPYSTTSRCRGNGLDGSSLHRWGGVRPPCPSFANLARIIEYFWPNISYGKKNKRTKDFCLCLLRLMLLSMPYWVQPCLPPSRPLVFNQRRPFLPFLPPFPLPPVAIATTRHINRCTTIGISSALPSAVPAPPPAVASPTTGTAAVAANVAHSTRCLPTFHSA